MMLHLLLLLAQEPAAGSVRAGNAALDAGDLAKAAEEYEAAIERDPSSGIALHNLGLVRLLQERPQEASTFLDRARAAGEGEVRGRSTYHLGHALFRASLAAESDPESLDRAIELARGARDAFLDVLDAAPDEDARANAEIAARRLEALEARKEEQEKQPESRPSSRPSEEGEGSGEDRPPEPESRPSEPESRPSSGSEEEEPETRPSEPETRPAQPETRPAEPETRPAQPETRPAAARPPLSPEEVQQILDRLAELERKREEFEAKVRRRERVRVERDW